MGKKEIIYLDLFSGIGGFAKGFQDAGLNIVKHYFSEIDKHAIAVYKNNFKNAQYAGDVRTISKRTITERPNIITFGFPCQDLSVAGKGKGLSGSRSGLFFEAARIIEELRPEVFIFENVKGLLSSNNGKDFETVLRTIADIGVYECEWQLVNTSWVLPQNRERVYFVGHLRGRSKPGIFPFRKSDKQFSKKHGHITETEIASCLQSPGNACGNYKGMNAVLTHYGHKDKEATEHKIVPTLKAESHGHEPMVYHKTGGYTTTIKQGVTGTLQAGGSNVMDKVPNVVIPVLTPDRKEKRQNGRRFKENGEPAFTLNTQDMHGVMITGVSMERTETGKQLRKEYESGELEHGFNEHRQPVPRKDGLANCIDTNEKSQKIYENTTIRRLTEIECERLQGFPDNWTMFGDYDGTIKEVAKTQRYKQLGNAVTTDMPRMIAERLSIFA